VIVYLRCNEAPISTKVAVLTKHYTIVPDESKIVGHGNRNEPVGDDYNGHGDALSPTCFDNTIQGNLNAVSKDVYC
jgi:hypothetical protein